MRYQATLDLLDATGGMTFYSWSYSTDNKQLTAVSNYLHQVHDALRGIPSGPLGPSTVTLGFVQRVADALQEDAKELDLLRLDFQASAKGKKDAHGRLKISKLKWLRRQAQIEELREGISWKKADIANAVALLQTHQG
jgi:hypothetical protein